MFHEIFHALSAFGRMFSIHWNAYSRSVVEEKISTNMNWYNPQYTYRDMESSEWTRPSRYQKHKINKRYTR